MKSYTSKRNFWPPRTSSPFPEVPRWVMTWFVNHRVAPHHLVLAASFLFVGACSSPSETVPANGSSTGSGSAGGASGGSGSAAMTGQGGTGVGGSAGASSSGTPGSSGTIATTGSTGSAGDDGGTTGTSGASGSATSDAGMPGDSGAPSATDPPPPRPIHVVAGPAFSSMFNGQPISVDTTKPIIGKLVLLLGGICGGPGAGGIESFIKQYGFHVFAPKTQTCVNTAPQMYKDIIAKTPNDPEANRQVGDARLSLWDGVNRVTWVTVAPGTSIVEETVAAIKYGMMTDQNGDWGFFLNTDGTLRTTDVWVVGYSWGSQTWAMISSYVRFGRVITTSGPQAEGFPNGTWITHPSATPADRKFMAVGFVSDYPSTTPIDIAPNTVTSMIDTTTKAGWIGPPMNVHPGDMGPFTGKHLFPMVGSNGNSPGGHTIFCTNNAANGWAAVCKYMFNVP